MWLSFARLMKKVPLPAAMCNTSGEPIPASILHIHFKAVVSFVNCSRWLARFLRQEKWTGVLC